MITKTSPETKQQRTQKQTLHGSVLRIQDGEPLLPANLAAKLLARNSAAKPGLLREMIDAGYLPESCALTIRPADIISLRRKVSARIGISQRASIRTKNVIFVD